MQLHMKIRPLVVQERRNKRKAERGFGPLAEGDRPRDRPSGRPSGSGEAHAAEEVEVAEAVLQAVLQRSGDTWWSGWGGSEWGGSRRWQSWERR